MALSLILFILKARVFIPLSIKKASNGEYILVDDFFNESKKALKQICEEVVVKVGLPAFVKPSNSGSSVGIKKAKNIIEVLQNDWKVNDSKIKMIINKSNIYQISESIIEEIFPGIKICGKIKYNDAYNLMINRSVDKKEIVKEYVRICERIV